VLKSKDVMESIVISITGQPDDAYRKWLVDKPYLKYLDILYSRSFRKYWIDGNYNFFIIK